MTIRAFSFGSGVQSMAALVLAVRGDIDFSVFVFANVGENTESPETLAYLREFAQPYAEKHGIEFVEVRREWKDGRGHTLYDSIMNPATKAIGIPVRFEGDRDPYKRKVVKGMRACTADFKIAPIIKWMRSRGATKESPGLVGLGISIDEFQRAHSSSGIAYYDTTYPLIDLRIDRAQCHGIIERAGLPVPPKSSCWFCPFHSMPVWRDMRRRTPDLFDKAAELEQTLIERRTARHLAPVYLTGTLRPLREAVGEHVQTSLFDEQEDACESGYCMT